MSELESINKIDFSPENISHIFENQRKNLKQDIIFLKEDVLKDFRRIESKLNNKYENHNSNTITKLLKFEKTIESMNNKIFELSSLIINDKNIHQKISHLNEFKIKTSDKLLSIDLSIKNNYEQLKEAINKYDKILTESVIYPGIIGNQARFNNFHELIDFILLNIHNLEKNNEKSVIDLKEYKDKLNTLLKSIQKQTDSIFSSCKFYADKKVSESEIKIKDLINIQESKIFDLRVEYNKLFEKNENKIEELKNEINKMLDIKIDIYTRFDKEVNSIKDLNKNILFKFDDYQNEFNSFKDKLNDLSKYIKDLKFKTNDGYLVNKKKQKIQNNNNSQFMRNSHRVPRNSVIKKYIKGEIGLNDIENTSKRKKSINLLENEMKNIIKNYNSYKLNKYEKNSSVNLSLSKRMTLGPEKLMILKNSLNKNNDINSLFSEKNKSNNSISEEKDDEIGLLNSFVEKKEDKKKKIKEKKNNYLQKNSDVKKENLKENIFYLEKNTDKNNNININKTNMTEKEQEIIIKKDKIKNENLRNQKILININKNLTNNNNTKEEIKKFLLNNKTKKDINSEVQTEITKINNIQDSDLKKQNKDNQRNDIKETYKSLSHEEKMVYENNKSFSKVINNNPKMNNIQEKTNKMNYQKKASSPISKLTKIGNGDIIINYNNNSGNKLSKTSIEFYDHKYYNINSFKNNNFKNENEKNKLHIIEVNFEGNKSIVKEKDNIKSIIKKIKENRIDLLSERNIRHLDKNKIYKKIKKNNSDINIYENNSINGFPNNNINDNYYYNKMVKYDLENKNSLVYLNYLKNNINTLNSIKIIFNQKNS